MARAAKLDQPPRICSVKNVVQPFFLDGGSCFTVIVLG